MERIELRLWHEENFVLSCVCALDRLRAECIVQRDKATRTRVLGRSSDWTRRKHSKFNEVFF